MTPSGRSLSARVICGCIRFRQRFLVGAKLPYAAGHRAGIDGDHGVDGAGLKPGDVAGLALLNLPYAWLALERNDNGYAIAQYDHITGKTLREPVPARICGCACTAISTRKLPGSATAPMARTSNPSVPTL